MGQPVVTVDVDGLHAHWDGTAFTGDGTVVEAARVAVKIGQVVDVFGLFPVQADDTDPVGAVAALSAHRPGRTRVTELPEDVSDWFDDAFAELRLPADWYLDHGSGPGSHPGSSG